MLDSRRVELTVFLSLRSFFLQQSENDEPGSLKYNEQLWRRERNEQITKEAKTASDIISRDIEGRLGSEPPSELSSLLSSFVLC